MKGKGNQQTYWLIQEDELMREIRTTERQLRRKQAEPNGLIKNGIETNGNCFIPRSSLKVKNDLPKNTISRCSSFESPKRLRFAENGNNKCRHDFLEVIVDSPCKKSSNSLVETYNDSLGENWKTSSTSCPCIENLANSAATLAQSQLSMISRDDKTIKKLCKTEYSSFPSLNIPKIPLLKATSAPSSPKKFTGSLSICNEHFLPWADRMPLLKVTGSEDQETNV